MRSREQKKELYQGNKDQIKPTSKRTTSQREIRNIIISSFSNELKQLSLYSISFRILI
jgi:hypothetical protein